MRLDAAYKLAPLELPPVPTYYGEFPISSMVEVIIRIAPIDGSDSPGAPMVKVEHVGFGPREEAVS
jgi:hypothetical protein